MHIQYRVWAIAKGFARDVPMTSRLWENVDTSWQVANKIDMVQKHAWAQQIVSLSPKIIQDSPHNLYGRKLSLQSKKEFKPSLVQSKVPHADKHEEW